MDSGLTRREILQAALALSPIVVAGCAATPTADRPALAADDPVSRSLAYYPNTRDVPADNPLATNHDVSQRCANCLRQRGSVGEGMLRCPTFPGRAISENGWCSLWTKG